jgi:hypothetical protein
VRLQAAHPYANRQRAGASPAAATEKFNGLLDRIKHLDARLAANASLQKHIVTYAKTRQTYVDYRRAGYSKKI